MSIPKNKAIVKHSTERDPVKKWRIYKMESVKMAQRMAKEPSLRNRAVRMSYCGVTIGAEKCPVCGRVHVSGGHMCHDRLCPLCQWRLSATRFAQMLQCLDVLDNSLTVEEASIGMMSLTLRNVPVYRLRSTLRSMAAAWEAMRHRAAFQKLVIGSARSVEITYNSESNTYHPHLHIFLITRPFDDEIREELSAYITKQRNNVRKHRINELKEKGVEIPEQLKKPIEKPKFTDDKFLLTEYGRASWQKALGIWYRPQVDYRYAYTKETEGKEAQISAYECISWSENKKQAALSAARECAKYVVGMKTLAEIPDKDLYRFACEISGVQMVSYSGILRLARQSLSFKDNQIQDVTPSEHTCKTCGSKVVQYVLTWAGGYYKEEAI